MKKHRILLIAILFLQSPVYAFGDPKPPSEFFELYDNEKTRKATSDQSPPMLLDLLRRPIHRLMNALTAFDDGVPVFVFF